MISFNKFALSRQIIQFYLSIFFSFPYLGNNNAESVCKILTIQVILPCKNTTFVEIPALQWYSQVTYGLFF